MEPYVHALGNSCILGDLEVSPVGGSIPERVTSDITSWRVVNGICVGAVYQEPS